MATALLGFSPPPGCPGLGSCEPSFCLLNFPSLESKVCYNMDMSNHVCRTCKLEKTQEEFLTNKKYKSGYESECAQCSRARSNAGNRKRYKTKSTETLIAESEANKRWALNNPEKVKYSRIKHRFNLSPDQYEALGNSCHICGVEKVGLHMDHDHSTKEVRGKLCSMCNQALGFFSDDIEKLKSAIDYLQKYKK